MTAPTPRPGIDNIAPYKGGDSALPGQQRIIKLASNESPFGPSPKAAAALKEAAKNIHRYPDGGCTALRETLAAQHNLNPDHIVCGAGSDDIFGLLCRAYTGPGDEVLYNEHGFLIFPIAAQACGATPVKAPETNLKADVDALLDAVTERTKILFLANPNNPTGSYLNLDELKTLRAGLRDDILFVIDAAYAEYVTAMDYNPGFEMVTDAANVIVTRSFSKIFGLGGARLGWAYGPAEVIDVLNRVRMPFNVTAPTQAAGLAALEDFAFVGQAREHNTHWRATLTQRLRDMGLYVPDSMGNFVLVRFPSQNIAEAADTFLRDHGIIVRRMAAYGLPDSLRMTVGLEDELDALTNTLTRFMETS